MLPRESAGSQQREIPSKEKLDVDRDLGKKGNSCRARRCRAGLLHVTPGNSENRNRRPRLETEKPRLKWWLLGPMLLPQQDLGRVGGCESWGLTEGSIRLCWQG